jgi:hypothetical protein
MHSRIEAFQSEASTISGPMREEIRQAKTTVRVRPSRVHNVRAKGPEERPGNDEDIKEAEIREELAAERATLEIGSPSTRSDMMGVKSKGAASCGASYY